MKRIGSLNDIFAGTFLLASGAFGFWLAWPLRSGTAAAMGSGYVPKMLALILMVLGAATIVSGFFQQEDELERWYPRQLVFILAALAFFGFTVDEFGIAVAILGLVLIGCLANREVRLFEAILLSLGLTLFTIVVFVKTIGMQVPLWPLFVRGF